MKIIREGKLPEEKLYEVTCQNCRTYFEFAKKEAKVQSDRNETYLSIKCPLCHQPVTKAL